MSLVTQLTAFVRHGAAEADGTVEFFIASWLHWRTWVVTAGLGVIVIGGLLSLYHFEIGLSQLHLWLE